MSTALSEQVDLYSGLYEPWKAEHEAVMAQYDLAREAGEVCALGLHVFSRLQSSLPQCNGSFDRTLSLQEYFSRWHQTSVELCDLCGDLESEEFTVENYAQLCDTIPVAVEIMSDLEDAAFAIQSVYDGKAISEEQFLNEL